MSAQDLFRVGARLLGVYLLANGLTSLPGIATAYFAAVNTSPANSALYTAAYALQLVLLIIVGAVLLIRYRHTSGNSAEAPGVSESALEVGAKLLGLWFAVSGVIGVVGSVGEAIVVTDWSFRLSHILSSVLYAVIGTFLMLRASGVATLLSAPAAAP